MLLSANDGEGNAVCPVTPTASRQDGFLIGYGFPLRRSSAPNTREFELQVMSGPIATVMAAYQIKCVGCANLNFEVFRSVYE